MSSSTSFDSPSLESRDLQRQSRLFSWMLSKKIPHIPSPEERTPYPAPTASVFSKLSFWWVFPVLKRGYKRTLHPDDLYSIPPSLEVAPLADEFEKHFDNTLAAAKKSFLAKARAALKKGKQIRTNEDDKKEPEYLSRDATDEEIMATFKVGPLVGVKALMLTFKWQYAYAVFCCAIAEGGAAVSPLMIKELIKAVEYSSLGLQGVGKGAGYAVGTTLVTFVIGLIFNQFFYNSMMTGAQAKSVLTMVLLRKSFRLNAESRHKFPVGKITSIMGTDCARIDFALGFQPFALAFPIPFVISIALLIYNIGVSTLVGIGVMLAFIVFIGAVTGQLFKYRAKTNAYTDKRVNLVKEVLNSLKMIKFYSWEAAYEKNLAQARTKEMNLIFTMQVLRNVVIAMAMCLTLFASMSAFLVLYRLDKERSNPAALFSSISLFQMLSQQTIFLPMSLASGSDGLLGLGRVAQVLSADEIVSGDDESFVEFKSIEAVDEKIEVPSIALKNAAFAWETYDLGEEEDFNEKKKRLKEEKKQRKQRKKEKKSGIVSPEKVESPPVEEAPAFSLPPLNLTVKKGDFVVITGIIGSGKSSLLNALAGFMPRTAGQMAISGSMVLCGQPWIQNATIRDNILFGSPLDMKRYQEVISACSLESDLAMFAAGDRTEVGERGITLSGGQKARISLARAVYANKDIILLDDVLSAVDAKVGRHIVNKCLLGLLGHKTRVLATHQLSLIGAADLVVFLNKDGTIDSGSMEHLRATNEQFRNLVKEVTQMESDPDKQETAKVAEKEEAEEKTEGSGRLIADEEKAVNQISMDVYAKYILLGAGKTGMFTLVPVFVFAMILSTFCRIFTNTWLSFWSELKFHKGSHFYISWYVVFTVLSFVFLVVQFTILVYITNTASVRMNIMATKRLLHAPMHFMDTTPMGRILNRFTKDTDVLDNEVSDQISFLLYLFCNIIGILVLCIIYMPWFAIAVPFMCVAFLMVANYYQASARELKRLEAVQRSVVYNNFNESLNGMDTIKAYGHEHRFLDKTDILLNKMNEAYFLNLGAQRWLTVMLDFLAGLFTLLIGILCACRVFNISAASAGLLLSYVYEVSGSLSMLLKTFTQVENEMNSCERMLEYAYRVPQEAAYVVTETAPPPNWPQGNVTFDHVSMAYREGLPVVLKELDFDIRAGEKVGICGRTGAGKSSIMDALYRLNELAEGRILVDGIDISTLGLHNLRKHLSIIPQDPVLFRGTVRKNLDPFDENPDSKLLDALRRTGLSFTLEQLVDDDGSNFSLGERQLVAFARALVRDSQILILDEATSSVDYETDLKIQETIRNEFSKCTILCIAHRLKTILNYDRVLVLDQGRKMEMDSPWRLYQSDGLFREMCERSGIGESDFPGHNG